MEPFTVSTVHEIARGLNIEGGDPYMRMIKDHNHIGRNNFHTIVWANIIVVLDRPLVDGIVFEDIFNDNRYPLLENRIAELNEHHFMAAFLMIIQYYVQNATKILNKMEEENVKITIHLHQDPLRMELCNIINKHLCMLMEIPNNIEIEYLTDTPTYSHTETDYSDTDILISLSQCAGLSPLSPPGSLFVSNTFIPYEVGSEMVPGNILLDKKVIVPNDLKYRMSDILSSTFNLKSVDYVNNHYESFNHEKQNNKQHVARYFTQNDFNDTPILQVNALWNPVNKNEVVNVVYNGNLL